MPGEYSQEALESHFKQTNARLAAIENQLQRVSAAVNVPYEQPLAEIPEDIKALAAAGKTLEAMKRYRELTNSSADKARDVIAQL